MSRAKRTRSWLAAAVLTTVAASCITVNVYFPAPEVRRAAEEIVEETWGDGEAAGAPSGTPEPQSWLDLVGPSHALAQSANIDVSTPAIVKLKSSIAARAPKLKPSLAAGKVGIGRDGLLVVRSTEGLPLKEQATVRQLVDAENRDRLALYREIAKANDFGDERIPEIQRIFAKTWIEKAEKGWWVQTDGGEWVQH